jgi:hypothetical protein
MPRTADFQVRIRTCPGRARGYILAGVALYSAHATLDGIRAAHPALRDLKTAYEASPLPFQRDNVRPYGARRPHAEGLRASLAIPRTVIALWTVFALLVLVVTLRPASCSVDAAASSQPSASLVCRLSAPPLAPALTTSSTGAAPGEIARAQR